MVEDSATVELIDSVLQSCGKILPQNGDFVTLTREDLINLFERLLEVSGCITNE